MEEILKVIAERPKGVLGLSESVRESLLQFKGNVGALLVETEKIVSKEYLKKLIQYTLSYVTINSQDLEEAKKICERRGILVDFNKVKQNVRFNKRRATLLRNLRKSCIKFESGYYYYLTNRDLVTKMRFFNEVIFFTSLERSRQRRDENVFVLGIEEDKIINVLSIPEEKKIFITYLPEGDLTNTGGYLWRMN